MKMSPSRTILMLWLFLGVLIGNVNFGCVAAENKLDLKGESFRSALRYAFAKTVCFTLEANWWTPLQDQSSFALTQKVHEKLGAAVKIDVYVRKEAVNRELIYVTFPDFQVGNYAFVLLLPHIDGKILTGNSVINSFVAIPSDGVYRQVDFRLPEDCQSIVNAEFNLKPQYVQHLRAMAADAIEEAYPRNRDDKHLFFRPFSPQFDIETTFYWLEGKKVIGIGLPLGTEKRPVKWKELFDFQQGTKSKTSADQASFDLRMNHEVTAHVANGLMLNIDANRPKRPN